MSSDLKNIMAPYQAVQYYEIWRHLAPEKNLTYKGKVSFCLTNHTQYGCQPIILNYDFKHLSGPHIHDDLFNDVHDWINEKYGRNPLRKFDIKLEEGKIYEMELSFRNFRFYYSKPKILLTFN